MRPLTALARPAAVRCVPAAARRVTPAARWATAAALCVTAVVVLCALFAGSAAAAPRGDSHSAPHGEVPDSLVRLENSITPALSARARSAGTAVAAGSRLHLTVTLKPRDPAALAAYAKAVSTPGAPSYHHYLSPDQFGHRFGATAVQLRRIRTAFARHGLTLGDASAGRLSIPLAANVSTIERGLDVQLRRVRRPDGRAVVAATRAPAIAAGAAPGVQSIVGLDSSSAPQPLTRRARHPGPLAQPLENGASTTTSTTTSTPTSTGATATPAGPQPCSAATTEGGQDGGYTDNQLAAAYGFTGLYQAGDTGAGTTVAVYELQPDSASDIAAFEACYGINTPISYVSVDGGAGHGAGSDEAAFDIENLIGFAPGAKVLVYQGPNAQTGAPGSGPYDTFAAIINQDRAQVVSVSWGGCEAQLGRADARAENTLFQQAAVQGQSIVAADGDNGAQDCASLSGPDYNHLSVDDPAAQPYVTGVGGTTLQGLSPEVYETAWNSKHDSAGPPTMAGSTGGGVSSFWPMPPAQLRAAKSLGVLSSLASGSHCGHAHGYCREVPDVSIDADPTTGYVVYWNGAGTVVGAAAGWQVLGGTSGAAPVWAALLALADSSPACAGKSIGYADPALYRAASSSYGRDFHDVMQGNNDFGVTTQGFSAKRGYDLATGLGTPDATRLVGSLCGDTIALSDVSAKQTPTHKQVSLRLHASDPDGGHLSWSAKGLPPGLTLNRSSGRVTGRAGRAGRYVVHATVRDSLWATATTRFTWTITKGGT
jgi:subtilase family serine protease